MGEYACTRCGERLVEVTSETASPLGLSSCERCGNANNTRAAYCWVCGSEMRDVVRIAPKPSTPVSEVQTGSAATPRTYRPDLNPVSTQTTKTEPVPSEKSDDVHAPTYRPDNGQPSAAEPPQDIPFEMDSGFERQADYTSGSRNAEIPPEIKRWNWAAFLMPSVWGLFSGVPIAVVLWAAVFLPAPFGQIVLLVGAVFLGAKGNEIAWRGKNWESVDHFIKFQKQWSTWAIRISVAFLVLALVYAVSVSGA